MNEQVRPMMLEQATSEAKRAKQPLLSRRYALEIRQQLAWHWQALIIGLALLLGLGISAAILVAAGFCSESVKKLLITVDVVIV